MRARRTSPLTARCFDAMTTDADQSLDDLRLRLAPFVADAAVFDGWSATAVRQAAEAAGIDPDVAAYAFKGGAMEMIAAWTAHVDRAMEQALSPADLGRLSIRERIRTLVQFRLDAIAGQQEALSRALAKKPGSSKLRASSKSCAASATRSYPTGCCRAPTASPSSRTS